MIRFVDLEVGESISAPALSQVLCVRGDRIVLCYEEDVSESTTLTFTLEKLPVSVDETYVYVDAVELGGEIYALFQRPG